MTEPPPGMDPTAPGGPLRVRPFLGGPGGPVERGHPADPAAEPTGLRPFVLTSGRVEGADASIGLETQVVALGGRATPNMSPESAAIVALCTEPLSVAEIAASLRMHLAVVRVLVGDLRSAGLVYVDTADAGRPHSPETILRVMRGLRAIS